MVAAGAVARLCYLDAPSYHPDETYPVALIERYRATGDLDVNLARVPMLGGQNTDQYAGSAYHHAMIAWDGLVRRTLAWPGEQVPRATLIRVRAFSALASALALALFAALAWREAGFWAAAAATALAAANPTLIQDAHFARPDSLLLLLFLGFVWLCRGATLPSLGRAAAIGVFLGLMAAVKNTMGLLAAVPLACALLAGGPLRPRVAFALAVGVASAAAFLAAEPDSWMHTRAFLGGLRTLSSQYSQPFPAQGPIDGGPTFGMAARYFGATLGVSTFGLMVLGATAWIRGRRWRTLTVWFLPLVAFGLLFGSHSNFFERSYGTFLPGVFLAAGVGAAFLAGLGRRWGWVAALLALLAVLPGARVSRILITEALSGKAEATHQAYAHRLREAAAPVRMINTWLCAPSQLEACLYVARQSKDPIILAVGDFGDEWTARSLRALSQALPVREIAVLPSPFTGLPMSSLPCYNGPTFRYLWIGKEPAPPLPVP